MAPEGNTGDRTDMADLVGAVVDLSSLVRTALDRRAGAYDISPVQARMLATLRDGAPTINELAAQLDLDKSSVSGLVDRAERRGLVRRVRSQLDRRSVRVRLSDRGREIADDVSARFSGDIAALLAPLPVEDRAVLAAQLKLLVGR
jgi:DNA-binding MarR family transcriptional regulator